MFQLDDVRVVLGGCCVLDTGHLELPRKSVVALMGPNGAGKTTLLRVLAGLQKPTFGHMTVRDQPTVGYVCQHQHVHPYMPVSVAETLMIGRTRSLGLFRKPKAVDREAVTAAAARLQVGHLMSKQLAELSGGQRQRVMIAMALASQPDCLLLDEPITGLDMPSQEIILDVIRDERNAGALVLLSTHHMQEASLCDRVLLLRGEVIADGCPGDVLNADNIARLFGTVPNSTSDALPFGMADAHRSHRSHHPRNTYAQHHDHSGHAHTHT